MGKFILALDQGTTSSRAMLFNKKGEIVSVAKKEIRQIYPKPGWVEHDAQEIWSTQAGVAAEAVASAGVNGNDIAGIGITNQRETTVVWDRKSGKPIYNAIVWQDRRTSDYCDKLKEQGYEDTIRSKTGLVIDSYFSATKVKWVLENVEGARKKANNGELAFGTIDSWLVWNLTNGEEHITDVTNASRTLLFNIHTMEWDDELLRLMEIPKSMLPDVRQSSEVYGKSKTSLFAIKVPVAGIAGDQQSALFGQMCTEPGMVKNTYGTGCFMLMNVGNEPVKSQNKLLCTVAWQIDGKPQYALEGSVFIGGAVVQWLRDELGIIQDASDVEYYANKVESSDGVYLVPAFSGLGAPHWNQHARGMLVGMTRGTSRAHLARAAQDAIAYQVTDLLTAMQADAEVELGELRVDGGATSNDTLLQFQSDLIGVPVIRPEITETTALGAAFLAGLAVGFWDDLDELRSIWQMERKFEPEMEQTHVEDLIKGWNRAVKASISWADDL